jgi:peptide/nickel transport system substrate-binding protein
LGSASKAGTERVRSIPPTPSAALAKTGGVLRWSGHGGLDTVDHWGSTAGITHAASQVWNDYLVAWDQQGNAQPQMLEDWTLSADAMLYTMTLRDGLKFWDGTAVTIDDVLPSLDKWHTQIDPVPKSVWDLAQPTQAKVDDKTFTLSMAEAFGVFPFYMGQSFMGVIPAALANKYPQSEPIPWEEIVGAGPMMVADYSPGNVLTYERYDAYNPRSDPKTGKAGSRQAYLDGIKLIDVPDANTKMAALETGQLDFTDIISNDFLAIAQDNPQLVAVIVSPDHSPGMFINKSIPPFNSVKARVAVQLVINYRDAMSTFGPPGTWQLGHQVFVLGGTWDMDAGIADMFESTDNFEPTPAMIARAQVLWAEAAEETGWDVTQPIQMMNATNMAHYGSLVVAKQNMEDAGFPVDMPAMDWATVASRSSSDCDWNLAITGWNAYDPIGNPGFSTTWKCGWDNQEVQDLIKEYSQALTLEAQQAVVAKIQIAKINDPPYIHYGQLNGLNIHRVEVKGYENFLQLSLDGVWLVE